MGAVGLDKEELQWRQKSMDVRAISQVNFLWQDVGRLRKSEALRLCSIFCFLNLYCLPRWIQLLCLNSWLAFRLNGWIKMIFPSFYACINLLELDANFHLNCFLIQTSDQTMFLSLAITSEKHSQSESHWEIAFCTEDSSATLESTYSWALMSRRQTILEAQNWGAICCVWALLSAWLGNKTFNSVPIWKGICTISIHDKTLNFIFCSRTLFKRPSGLVYAFSVEWIIA